MHAGAEDKSAARHDSSGGISRSPSRSVSEIAAADCGRGYLPLLLFLLATGTWPSSVQSFGTAGKTPASRKQRPQQEAQIGSAPHPIVRTWEQTRCRSKVSTRRPVSRLDRKST